MTDRETTHAPGCWDWGPKHYECAVGQVERDEALLRQALHLIETMPVKHPDQIAPRNALAKAIRDRLGA